MTEDQKKPICIRIGNCENANIHGNLVRGDMDFIVAENVKNLNATKNIHITPEQESNNSYSDADNNSDYWYKRPIGIIMLSVIAGLVIWAITHFLEVNL